MKRLATLIALSAASIPTASRQKQWAETVADEVDGVESVANELIAREPQ